MVECSAPKSLAAQSLLSEWSSPDAAEYGRQHGLTIDCFRDDPLSPCRGLVAALSQEQNDRDGVLPWNRQQGGLNILGAAGGEKLEVSGVAQEFLQAVCGQRTETDVQDTVAEFVNRTTTYTRRLKMEPPILLTDNEVDCREYSRTLNGARKARLDDHHLPLEPVDSDKDEGLEFPDWMYRVGIDLDMAVDESFEAEPSGLELLTASLESDWTATNESELLEQESKYLGVRFPNGVSRHGLKKTDSAPLDWC